MTPIYVDRFEDLLKSHPNQPFVKSVCRSLREGFWPWADTHFSEYPDTLDLSLPDPDNADEAEFLRSQRDHEVFKGRFSEPFGDKLLPGMYCMPIFAVPKPHSTDLRMVTDQSAGKFSLNSMIPREDIIGYPLSVAEVRSRTSVRTRTFRTECKVRFEFRFRLQKISGEQVRTELNLRTFSHWGAYFPSIFDIFFGIF